MGLTLGSLCTGGGGLDLAVKAMYPGIRPLWVSETAKWPSLLLRLRWPKVENIGSVARDSFIGVDRADIIVGGIPCQPFSPAGYRKEEADRRDLSWIVPLIAEELQPSLILLENVQAFGLSAAWDEIRQTLREQGYLTRDMTLAASALGGCHQRRRWFAAIWPVGAEPLQPEGSGRPSLGNPTRKLLPTPTVKQGRNATLCRSEDATFRHGVQLADVLYLDSWEDYREAIDLHAEWIGQEPPPFTVGHRQLNARFVEWMLGWPFGWAADIDIPRSRQLEILGNGVVMQQAEYAFRYLLGDPTP